MPAVFIVSLSFVANLYIVTALSRYAPRMVPPQSMLNTGGLTKTNGTTTVSSSPCACETASPLWVPPSRTTGKCVFIDLGAANGNSFEEFLNNKYGPVANCASWEARLVEANPLFDEPLKSVEAKYPGQVHASFSTAAYMCEAQTSFFLDTVNVDKNFWGSSLSSTHADVQASGKVKVTVPTINLNRLLYESTIPADWVIVKMDIEGAEWDILPCMAQSLSSSTVDALYMEVHPASWGMIGTTEQGLEAAKQVLMAKGVQIPSYFSET
eukprot:CAMPEP_0194502238 /NCGR_PEP_ID=MMETSP0253-20130528/24923_1 /TAXON_ID=2966 /ORGANISM="Noctiluca scintillans" /LENGTH=267 /DNA_ID=CAMNT_0039344355 /DNA_START=41 /DNA_END=844 /DNA_ORIENTATION=-